MRRRMRRQMKRMSPMGEAAQVVKEKAPRIGGGMLAMLQEEVDDSASEGTTC